MIDARIPLGVNPLQLNQQRQSPLNMLAKVTQIQSLLDQSDMNAMKMKQALMERQQQEQFFNSLPEPDSSNPLARVLHQGVKARAIPFSDYAKAIQPKELPFQKIDPKDYTEESVRAFAMSGGDHTKLIPVRKSEFVNGQAVNPYQTAPGTVIPKQLDPTDPRKDLLVPGPDGKLVPNSPLVGLKKDIAKSGASSVSVNTGQKGLDNELSLHTKWRNEPIYKAHQEVQSAHSQITAALKQASPAGDLAGATKIMKILDPTSVVRESELGMAMAATGALDRLQYYATNVINGTKLNPKQRADFQNLADKLYAESAKHYNSKRGEYAGFATDYGLGADRIVGPAITSPRLPIVGVPGAPQAKPAGARFLGFE